MLQNKHVNELVERGAKIAARSIAVVLDKDLGDGDVDGERKRKRRLRGVETRREKKKRRGIEKSVFRGAFSVLQIISLSFFVFNFTKFP